MPTLTNNKAADAHEATAKTHRSAAELAQKGDHKTSLDHSEKAVKLSETAHAASTAALAKAKAPAHT